jgi:uncharacterized YigZ family protein
MVEDTFLSLKTVSEALFKEKGSKFIAYAFPVNSEDEVKAILSDLKKKYYDARHHCYAYAIGKKHENYRANDDGEPNHSAGDPILGQIKSYNLTNALIVVIRYFGGTKLGVSGLIHAYKTAAAMAIENNGIVEKVIQTSLKVDFPYVAMNEVMRVIKDYDLTVLSQKFEMDCCIELCVRLSLLDEVVGKLKATDAVEVSYQE